MDIRNVLKNLALKDEVIDNLLKVSNGEAVEGFDAAKALKEHNDRRTELIVDAQKPLWLETTRKGINNEAYATNNKVVKNAFKWMIEDGVVTQDEFDKLDAKGLANSFSPKFKEWKLASESSNSQELESKYQSEIEKMSVTIQAINENFDAYKLEAENKYKSRETEYANQRKTEKIEKDFFSIINNKNDFDFAPEFGMDEKVLYFNYWLEKNQVTMDYNANGSLVLWNKDKTNSPRNEEDTEFLRNPKELIDYLAKKRKWLRVNNSHAYGGGTGAGNPDHYVAGTNADGTQKVVDLSGVSALKKAQMARRNKRFQ